MKNYQTNRQEELNFLRDLLMHVAMMSPTDTINLDDFAKMIGVSNQEVIRTIDDSLDEFSGYMDCSIKARNKGFKLTRSAISLFTMLYDEPNEFCRSHKNVILNLEQLHRNNITLN